MIPCCSSVLNLLNWMDDPIVLAASALVRPDGFHQVGRASIVEEEDALPDAPKRSRPELVRAGGTLRNAVGEAFCPCGEPAGRRKDALSGSTVQRLGPSKSRWQSSYPWSTQACGNGRNQF